MKLFFISDIHGSASCLETALGQAEKMQEDGDLLVLLGDLLYHGARNPLPEGYDPKKVTALLNRWADRVTAVRGNCDSEVDQMVLDFPIMSEYSTILGQGKRIFLTHGHHFGPEQLPKLRPGDVFISGHTHIPLIDRKENILVLNPGSVSLPKEGHPRTFAVLEENRFTIWTLDGKRYMETALSGTDI